MGVEVQKPASVHEGRAGLQLPLHQRTGPVGSLLTSLYLLGEPLVERLRDVLQEQREARSGPLKGLDPTAHLRAASPIGHDPLHVGEFLGKRGRVRQHAPVVHQREPLVLPSEHPVRRHGVHGELPPRPETGPATDAVLAVGRNPEQVGRGPRVLRQPLPPGERHPLHEDRLPVDLQQRGRAADTGAKGQGGVDELAQPAVTVQGEEGGDGTVGGQACAVRHTGLRDRSPHRNADLVLPVYARASGRCLRTVREGGQAGQPSAREPSLATAGRDPVSSHQAHSPRAATRRYDRSALAPSTSRTSGTRVARCRTSSGASRSETAAAMAASRTAESGSSSREHTARKGTGRSARTWADAGSPFQENEDLHPNQCHVVTEGRPERLNAPIRGARHDQGPDA
ncbi:protein of unknown function [Streptomyces sp. KY75]|nr:protein of unknown function [Streptomyces sp. KY70]CAD5977882.1 protein of unknown function [Streptomyces sp. KY75]